MPGLARSPSSIMGSYLKLPICLLGSRFAAVMIEEILIVFLGLNKAGWSRDEDCL
jgi:hypothetical protein